MDFQDFPKILGNLGVETDHPPKMCAGLPVQVGRRKEVQTAELPQGVQQTF